MKSGFCVPIPKCNRYFVWDPEEGKAIVDAIHKTMLKQERNAFVSWHRESFQLAVSQALSFSVFGVDPGAVIVLPYDTNEPIFTMAYDRWVETYRDVTLKPKDLDSEPLAASAPEDEPPPAT